MSQIEPASKLASADQSREREPLAALAAYAALPVAEVVSCVDRVAWIFGRPARELGREFLSLAEHVSENSQGLACRQALHLRATWHSLAADSKEAGALWQRAVVLGRSEKDELWMGCALNLSMVLGAQGRAVESLILVGAAGLAAEMRGDSYSTAYALLRRSTILIMLGDFTAAEKGLRKVSALLPRFKSKVREAAIAFSEALAWARLYRAKGEFEPALKAQLYHIELGGEMAVAHQPLVVDSHCSRIMIEYELYEDRRDDLLSELERIPEIYPLGGNWTSSWRYEFLQMRLQQGLRNGEEPAAQLACAMELMEHLAEHTEDALLVGRASDLGKLFKEEMGSLADSQKAYELAAAAALRSFVRVAAVLKDLPEMQDVTPEDMAVIVSYRRRMERDHEALFLAISDLWRAGHPAVALATTSGEMVRACAWCSRVDVDGQWIPVTHFLPASSDFRVTHGVCAQCAAELTRTLS